MRNVSGFHLVSVTQPNAIIVRHCRFSSLKIYLFLVMMTSLVKIKLVSVANDRFLFIAFALELVQGYYL